MDLPIDWGGVGFQPVTAVTPTYILKPLPVFPATSSQIHTFPSVQASGSPPTAVNQPAPAPAAPAPATPAPAAPAPAAPAPAAPTVFAPAILPAPTPVASNAETYVAVGAGVLVVGAAVWYFFIR